MAKRSSIMLSLIRCGETTWDAEGRLSGRSDLPLSIDGRASVREDAEAVAGLTLGTVHHAPDDAAAETAQITATLVKSKRKPVADLAEADLGVLDGMSLRAFADRFPKRYKQWQEDPLSLSPPEGEDLSDARARIFSTALRLLRRSRSEAVALVLHPLSLGFLRCWLADRPATDLWTMVRRRPRIERYALSPGMLDWLQEAARAEYTHSR